MGKYQVLDEVKAIGIEFPERSKEDALIEVINRLGYNVHMNQSGDRTWRVWIFKHKGVEVVDHASTRYHTNRLDALKEACWLAIDR